MDTTVNASDWHFQISSKDRKLCWDHLSKMMVFEVNSCIDNDQVTWN